MKWLKLFHRHKWKIDGYGIYGIGYMIDDCDRVPLSCKCGSKALGKWRRDYGMVEVFELTIEEATNER